MVLHFRLDYVQGLQLCPVFTSLQSSTGKRLSILNQAKSMAKHLQQGSEHLKTYQRENREPISNLMLIDD